MRILMSIKNLEKYQENWYNNTSWLNFPDQQETKEEEKARLDKIKQNREKNIITHEVSVDKFDRDIEHALWELESNKDNFYDNDVELDYIFNY